MKRMTLLLLGVMGLGLLAQPALERTRLLPDFGTASANSAATFPAGTFFTVDTANVLRHYSVASPGTVLGAVTISGLQPAESILGIDFRPATGQLLLGQVEGLIASRGSTRDIISQSRAAVQVAEEARLQSVARRVAEEAEAVRAAAAASERAARDAGERAEQQALARRAAEDERERAEAERERAEEERERAEQVAQQNVRERERAEQGKREADIARADAEAQAARAEALRAQAEQDRVALRETLRRQFSDILDTRDTTRGLIVNVGDLLFETGQYELRPSAREKLARFAGIVLPYQGLSVQVEGFTDSTGSDALNERLSRQRADAVARFLIGQGLAPERLRSRGYGPADPIASNDTPEGRQRNRRVELVVSGEMIGTPIGTPDERPVGTTGRER